MPRVPEVPGVWRKSRRKRAEVAIISALGYPILRLLASTWRYKVVGDEHVDAIHAKGLHPIHSFWHGRILPLSIHFMHRGIVVITSENFDGEWIARIIHKMGFGTARGSTSRGGAKALLKLVRDVKSKGVAFTLDGPRGPREVAQPGAVWLSKATGNPLLPFHGEVSSSWTLNSWDRTVIPKPFATIALVIREPIYVPRDADEVALDKARTALEASLTEARVECQRLLAGR